MNPSTMLLIFVICGIINFVGCNRERKLAEILDGVHRIEEHLQKEDRLREITDIVRLDTTVDRLNKKLDRVIDMLESSSPPASGRSVGAPAAVMSRDLAINMEVIDGRLTALENTIVKIEQSTSKMDIDGAKIEEIERRTTQLKDDVNTKLRKIMNVITALYEMNKEMKSNMMGGRIEAPEQAVGGSTSSYATEFLIENLEELERKIKEQFSVLASDLRSEITSLKIVASSVSANCETESNTDEEDEWMTPRENARSMGAPIRPGTPSRQGAPNRQGGRSSNRMENTLDNLVESLGRSTREIREEIHQGMQDLDKKLNNLTVLAQAQPQCDDPMQASESQVNSRSAIARPRLVEQTLAGKQTSRSEACTKSSKNAPNPKSCADLRKGGATCDGIYVIFPKSVRAVRVYCDMTTEGGGWTMLMRRGEYGDKMTTFHKNWASYKNGFGDSEGEFWIGNDVMNLMTTEEDNMLRIHMTSFDDDEINLDYSSFAVGNESSNYLLNIGLPIGESAKYTAANSLRYHNNHPFSTFDRKNDGFDQNCATTYKGGWWFNGCYFGFLTGEYFKAGQKRESWQGIIWHDWKGSASLKGAEMMIRPKNFTDTN